MPQRKPRPAPRTASSQRRLIATEAARIIHSEGQRDFLHAKRKAAERLGFFDARDLPNNREIEHALKEHQALFRTRADYEHLQDLRRAALNAMDFFAPFQPRLVGPVLEGTADRYAAVSLHVFAETPDEVYRFLIDKKVPFDEVQRRQQVRKGRHEDVPVVRFLAGDVPVDVSVLAPEFLRHPPLSPLTAQPVRRANRREVEGLLDESPIDAFFGAGGPAPQRPD